MVPKNTLDQKVADFDSAVREQLFDAVAILLAQNPSKRLAALRLLVGYFEPVGKYAAGFAKSGESKKHFIDGFMLVLERSGRKQPGTVQPTPEQAARFYELVRSGLAHGATLSFNVGLGVGLYGLAFGNDGTIVVNPERLLEVLRKAHEAYLKVLREPSRVDEGKSFEARWDYEATL